QREDERQHHAFAQRRAQEARESGADTGRIDNHIARPPDIPRQIEDLLVERRVLRPCPQIATHNLIGWTCVSGSSPHPQPLSQFWERGVLWRTWVCSVLRMRRRSRTERARSQPRVFSPLPVLGE